MQGAERPVRIARIAPAELGDYKRLRDEGLALHPEAFDADVESERARPPESFIGRLGLSDTLGGSFLLGAWDQSELIGMIGLERQSLAKLRHTSELNSMMVSPKATGRGVGRALLAAAIAEARQAIGLEQIVLQVSSADDRAVRLYERAGFQSCGVRPHAIKLVDGPGQARYFDRLTMVLIL
jgi:ribosomal protein S18 acetylase RimI-like enzyme